MHVTAGLNGFSLETLNQGESMDGQPSDRNLPVRG